MYAEDYCLAGVFGIIALALLILCSAGAYAIVKKANNPKDFKTYEINGNIPTLITKEIK